jgi:DNA-directed RNA polymerase subunit RPC12/RpoP
MRGGRRQVQIECIGCGTRFSMMVFAERLACTDCAERTVVFSRDRGLGRVPLNLQRAYRVNASGRPARNRAA